MVWNHLSTCSIRAHGSNREVHHLGPSPLAREKCCYRVAHLCRTWFVHALNRWSVLFHGHGIILNLILKLPQLIIASWLISWSSHKWHVEIGCSNQQYAIIIDNKVVHRLQKMSTLYSTVPIPILLCLIV